ncbi:MAG: M48 family metalloprotease [Acidobacteria bacterium]|nr:M48 family metalloprotease [Acidobacteriota bacterium]
MKKKFFRNAIALVLTASLVAGPVLAQGNSKSKGKPLDVKNDPTLIGKRDINKGNLSFYSIDREVALGRQMSLELDRRTPLVSDPIVTEFVNRVAQNIVLHSDAKVPFTVKVVDANEVNAFALPGGFLYVNRGLLEAADNEAEVAGVMAHEIAHVAARHGIEQASKGQLLQYGSIPLIFLGGLGGFVIQQAAGIALPLTFLKFSRGAEKEADRLGAQYMWASGYDPNALITFFEKLQAQERRKPGTLEKIFSTHPMTGDRISEVRDLIVRFPDRSEYQLSTSEFNEVKSRLAAVSVASRPGNSRDDKRPTLKRRPRDANDDRSIESDDSDAPNRPVLKRRDNSSEAETSSSDSSPSSDDSGRPVLKRREGAAADPSDSSSEPASQSSDDTGRPVLKRHEGSESTSPPQTPQTKTPTSKDDSNSGDTPGRPKLKKNNQSNDSTSEKQSPGSSSTKPVTPSENKTP